MYESKTITTQQSVALSKGNIVAANRKARMSTIRNSAPSSVAGMIERFGPSALIQRFVGP